MIARSRPTGYSRRRRSACGPFCFVWGREPFLSRVRAQPQEQRATHRRRAVRCLKCARAWASRPVRFFQGRPCSVVRIFRERDVRCARNIFRVRSAPRAGPERSRRSGVEVCRYPLGRGQRYDLRPRVFSMGAVIISAFASETAAQTRSQKREAHFNDVVPVSRRGERIEGWISHGPRADRRPFHVISGHQEMLAGRPGSNHEVRPHHGKPGRRNYRGEPSREQACCQQAAQSPWPGPGRPLEPEYAACGATCFKIKTRFGSTEHGGQHDFYYSPGIPGVTGRRRRFRALIGVPLGCSQGAWQPESV
jgi:hypothetical protein